MPFLAFSLSLFTLSFCCKSAISAEGHLLRKCAITAIEPLRNTRGNFIHIIHREHGKHITVKDIILADLVRNINQTIIISDKMLNSSQGLQYLLTSGYLVVALNQADLKETLNNIDTKHINWRPDSMFLVLLPQRASNESITERRVAEEIAAVLRSFNIGNILILIENSNMTMVNAYTWFPFASNNHCGSRTFVQRINRCTSNGFLSKTISLYPPKIPGHFSKCVFRAVGFNWPPYVYEKNDTKEVFFGYNVVMMELFARKYNFTLIFVHSDQEARWGTLLDNGTWTGALGILQAGKADVTMGGSLLTIARIHSFDYSPTYNSVFMKFYLPLPLKLPHWKNMIQIFSPEFWITLWIVYLITSVVTWMVSKLNENTEKYQYQRLSDCFLILWRISVGGSADSKPKSRAVRIIFLLWLIYNFHIIIVYTSSLLGFITKPAYNEPMRTMEELSNSDLHIRYVKQFVQVMSMMDEEYKQLILRKTDNKNADLYSDDANQDIERMLHKRDIVILDTQDHFEVFAKDKTSRTYFLDDTVRLNPGMYVPKGSMFLQLVDEIQLDIRENGIFQKLENDVKYLNKYDPRSRNYNNEVTLLSLQELSGPFYVLLFGLSLSMLVFMFEVLTFKWCCKRVCRSNVDT